MLTEAIFTDAIVKGTDFTDATTNGFTSAQFYSTRSYKEHNLSRINLSLNNMTGWIFVDQNLTGADFTDSNLADANLSLTNLTNTRFSASTLITNANLSGADLRGAQYITFISSAIVTNTIRPDGSIQGLNLSGDNALFVRDYDGDPGTPPDYYPSYPPHGPIAIKVQNGMNMGADGILKMIFEEDAWDSTISFDPGILVTLGGTLELTFADGVNVSGQVGRTFQVFDWTGVTPTGTFNVDSPYVWDSSRLYTMGEVTLLAVPEPATLGLLAAGILGPIWFRRRGGKHN